jgi:hypothetical protein
VSNNTYIIVTGLVVVGVGGLALMTVALAVLLRVTFPSGRPATQPRRTSSRRHSRPVPIGSHRAGAAPPRPAHGATA